MNLNEFVASGVNRKVVLKDGTELSIRASENHYCKPGADTGPYTHVEVGYLTADPPESWHEFTDLDYPSGVYACVPVALVCEFIETHGGL